MPPSLLSSTSRISWPRLLTLRRSFTPEEVRLRLQSDDTAHPRTAAVHAAAAQTPVWTGRLSEKMAYELGRAGTRLPTVVYWHRQGLPPQDIGRRLSPLGSTWDGNRALGVAMALIASVLNDPVELAV